MAKQIRDYRQTKLTDGTEIHMRTNYDDISSSSDEELPPMTPLNTQIYKPNLPHFFDKFYMVQTLYDKFLRQDSTKQIQLLYALVILSRENCTAMENALQEGKTPQIIWIFIVRINGDSW